MAVIDFHTHVFPEAVAADRQPYLDTDPAFRSLYADPKARIATADGLVEAMDRAGIERSVMCGFGWSAPELCVRGNDAILEAVARYPDRLAGLGTVAPGPDPEEAVRELRRIRSAGLLGLGELRPDAQGWLGEHRGAFDVLAAEIVAENALVLLHASEPVGHRYAGKEGASPGALEPLLERLRGAPTVLAHAGGGLPFYAYMPEVAELLRDVYVDTAALPFLYRPAVLDALAAAHGADRLLFGTDYPLMEQERTLRYVDESGLNAGDKERLLGGNAEALLARVAGGE